MTPFSVAGFLPTDLYFAVARVCDISVI